MPRVIPSTQTVPVGDGRALRVHDWPGRGPAIVLLHGLLDTSAGWHELAGVLRQRCVAVDLPGFGGSDLPVRPRVSAYAQDVVAVMEALGLRDVVLVGHSLGGAVAAAIVDRAPELVTSVVLLAPAGFGRIGLAEAVSVPGVRNVTQQFLPLALGNRLVVGTAYRRVVTNGAKADAAVVDRIVGAGSGVVAAAREGTRAVVAAGRSHRAFHRRRIDYDGPVRVVWGTADRLVPRAHAKGVLTALPQARLLIWPGMGHHPQHERPSALADLVREAVTDARPGRVSRAVA